MQRIGCALLGSLTLAAAGCATGAMGPDALEAPQALLLAQQEAWNRGDLEGFLDGYRRDAKIAFLSDQGVQRGFESVRRRYLERYPDRAAMGKLAFSDLEVVELGPKSALVLGHWRLDRERDRPHGVFSVVLFRYDEGWRILHDHTSLVGR